MAMEGMHHELLSYLQKEGAIDLLIQAWESAWYNAQRFPGEPLPCPACFLRGRVQRLTPLDSVGDVGSARCEYCKTKFKFAEG